MPLTVSETIPVIEHWISVASAYDFQVLFETHRNATLNDFFATARNFASPSQSCAFARTYLTLLLIENSACHLAPIQETYFERVLQRSDSFQGRISNNEQIQISVQFPQHQAWVPNLRPGGEQAFMPGRTVRPRMPPCAFWSNSDHRPMP